MPRRDEIPRRVQRHHVERPAQAQVKLDGQEYLIMKESDVLGVIDNVAPMRAVKTVGFIDSARQAWQNGPGD